MSKPSLSQIVNLCSNQKMNLMYIVKGNVAELMNTSEVLEKYEDVEIVALVPEIHSSVNLDFSISYLEIFKVFI